MIIECKACHARFRLDESKIKGRGARVKCRKCGEPIVVLKDVDTGLSSRESGKEGSLDLSSALRESSHGVAAQSPPPDNLIRFPGPGRAAESPGAAGKDEVDLAFEQLLAGSGEPPAAETREEPPSGASPEPPTELTFEPPAELTFEPPADLTFEPPAAPTFEPLEESADRPAPESPLMPSLPSEDAPSSFAGETAPEFTLVENLEMPPPPDEGILLSDAETMRFLQGEHPQGKAESADISLSIAANPPEPGSEFQLDSTPLHVPGTTESAAASTEGISVEGNATPPAETREAYVPPYREDDLPAPADEPEPSRVSAAKPASASSGRSFARIAGIVLLIALLSAAGYFGFTPAGKRLAVGAFPGLSALLGGGATGKAVSSYEVKNVIGYFDGGAASPRILVIKGQVTNLSSGGKSGIRVFASLLDNTGKVMMEQAVYAGNVLPGARLKTDDRATLEKALANPLGEHLSNMDVLPGKTVPFMVLFFDAPEDIDSYRLEAKDAQ